MKGKRKNTRKASPRKPYTDRSNREEAARDYDSPRNDVSWYSRNPNLLVAAGSFPFPYRPGMKMDFGTATAKVGEQTLQGTRNFRVPGILTLDWLPSIGYSESATDPASIMAKEIYAKVRSKYSGSLDADAPDFVVYLGALDSLFSYIAWLKRLYRVMNAWTPENYVLPEVVLSAMGLTSADIQSLREDRVKLWQNINELVLQSRKFTCPASMDLFNRHYWMSDNVYTDENTINSQFYMFNLKAVYQFAMLNMPDGNPGPGLQMVAMPTISNPTTDVMTTDRLYKFGRGLIDALVAWDDAYTINGYLMRAYEGVPSFIVDELPVDQPFNPVYEPEVLAQIENSRTIPAASVITDFSGFNVTQDVVTNAVISKPSYTTELGYDSGEEFETQGYMVPPTLSVRSTTPTVADSVIASRLQAALTDVTITGTGTAAKATATIVAGTEIPLVWRMLEAPAASRQVAFRNNVVRQTATFVNLDTVTTADQLQSQITSLLGWMAIEQYDWHPFIFLSGLYTIDGTTNVTFRIVGDTHNITTITVEDLRNLHKICVYSELNAFSF